MTDERTVIPEALDVAAHHFTANAGTRAISATVRTVATRYAAAPAAPGVELHLALGLAKGVMHTALVMPLDKAEQLVAMLEAAIVVSRRSVT